MKQLLFFIIFLVSGIQALAQAPVINSFTPTSGLVGSTVTITGANFDGTTPANNQVFFGSAEATVLTSSFGTLTVSVPGASTTNLISVRNATNGLTGYARNHFNGLFCDTPLDNTTYGTFNPTVNGDQEMTGVYGAYNIDIYDIDGDGKSDIITGKNNGGLTIAHNQSTPGTMNFVRNNINTLGYNVQQFFVADYDGDGKRDILISGADGMHVFRNLSTPGTISFSGRIFVTSGNFYQCAAGDLDGDGKIDIVGGIGNYVYFYKNNSTGPGSISFSYNTLRNTGSRPNGLQVVDVDGDGQADVVGTHRSLDRIFAMRNTTTGSTFTFAGTQVFSTVRRGPYRLKLGDFDKDGNIDLVMPLYEGARTCIFRNSSTSGSISFDTPLLLGATANNYRVGVGDVNGDGFPDIVTKPNGIGALFQVYKNVSTGPGTLSFNNAVTYYTAAGSEVGGIAIGDMDGDFVPDIATSGISSNKIRFHRNTSSAADTDAPTAICKDIVVALDPTGNVTVTGAMIDDGSGDACGLAPLLIDGAASINFTCSDIGSTVSVLRVTDLAGNTAECNATITIAPAAIIVAGQTTVCQGETITMTANVGDSYQWYKDGVAISGATSQQYIVTETGSYTVQVVNVAGCSGISDPLVATVNENPTVNISPAGVAYLCQPSNTAVLTASASSIYQWYKDGVLISGATNQTYTANSTGDYSVEVIDLFGCSAVSDPVTVLPELVCTGPSDLNFWSQKGEAASGNWTVNAGGEAVFQSINGFPTFYVSPETFFNTTIEGTFEVASGAGDDDFIGFVIGFEEPSALTSYPMTGKFIVFDWKRGDQSIGGGGFAANGYYLAKVDGTFNSGQDMHWALWDHVDSRVTQLATQYGGGWSFGTEYTFSIDYSATNITIRINGTEIYNVNGTFSPGKFGFYNNSQSQVTYSGFTQEFTVGVDGTDEVCPGSNNGSATANPSSFGVAPFTYNWSNGGNTQTITNLAPGTYCVTVSDSKGCQGCSAEACVEIGTAPDTELPVLSDCSLLEVSSGTDDGQCSAVLSTGTPTATDNCSVTITQTAGLPSGSAFPVGTTTQTFKAEDQAGNSVTCSYSVTVTDDENPVINGQNNNLLMDFNTTPGAPPSYTEQGITFLSLYGTSSHVHLGNIGGDSSGDLWNHSGCCSTPYRLTVNNGVQFSLISFNVVYLTGPATFSVYPSGPSVTINSTGLFTFPASFSNATEIRWSQPTGSMGIDDMIVSTTTTGVCPANIEVFSDLGQCGAVVNYSAEVTDNCSASISFNRTPGSFFNVGTETVTVSAEDPSGNTSSCTFDVTVTDNEYPVLADCSPFTRNVGTDPGQCSATLAVGIPMATDNCSVTVTQIAGLSSGSAFPVGVTTQTFEAEDPSGNKVTCSYTVTVSDDEDPVIVAPGDVVTTISVDGTGDCTVAIDLHVPYYDDNCPVITHSWEMSGAIVDSGPGYIIGNYTFPIGVTTITFYAYDGSGNDASDSMTVTVSDDENPFWTAEPSDMTVQCDGTIGASGQFATWLASFSGSDQCSNTTLSDNSSGLSDECGATGSETVTFTLTDSNGNSITKAATFTIEDTTDPAITCPASMQTCADQDLVSGAVVSWTEPTPTDACGSASAVSDYVNGGVYSVGITTVTYTATDECGRQTQCNFNIEVWELPEVDITESELPVYCQENSKILSANVVSNTGGITYSWDTGSTTDTIHVQASGVYNVEVTDSNGCTRGTSYNVTVVPQNLLSAYTIIGEDDVHLHGNNVVLNGGVGVLDDKGKAKVHDESFVTGATTFVQSDKIELDNDSGIDNEILTPSTVSLPPFYANLFDSDNDVTVDKNTIDTLTEQVYGKIDVKEGSTVVFTQTDLYIEDLKTKEDVILKFPPCAFVRVEKNLDFYKNVTVNPDGHQVQFFVDSNVEVKEGSLINASIDARGHNMNVKGKDDNPTFMNGQFIGKKIHGSKYVTWDWGTACDPGCEPGPDPLLITCECYGGMSSVTVDYSGGAGAGLTSNDGTVTDNGDGTYTISNGGAKLEKNLEVYDGSNTGQMHTSCSQDILGQTFGGEFTVVAYTDMHNETSTVVDCAVLVACDCNGGMSSVTVDYSGGSGAGLTSNDGTVTDNGDGSYTISNGGVKLEKNLEVYDGTYTGEMHTSCSQDILGQVFDVVFTVVAHTDMNNETSTVADCPNGVDRQIAVLNANAYGDLSKSQDTDIEINTEQSENITEARIYPNPTSGNVTIDLNVDKAIPQRLMIFNTRGELVMDRNVDLIKGFNSRRIDMSEYQSGLYFIRIGDLPMKRLLVIN